MEKERSESSSLLQYIVNQGLIVKPEDDSKRKDVIEKLKKIVHLWIKKVAWQRCRPKPEIVLASATIFVCGSYGLGVHRSDSDIDAVCVGPRFATAEDFFVVLRNMLQNRQEVSDLLCVNDARVPLMCFKFNGISVDLPYAQLQFNSVPADVDILNPIFVRNIDKTSWKCLSGVHANLRILELVPDVEKFQSVLRCLKLWAQRRGVYSNLNGFFGGIHIGVLTAYVCQRYPNASTSSLMSTFFETFAFWPWPTPVLLEEGFLPANEEFPETCSLMPIQLPGSPHELCDSNMTKSTFQKIRAELLRGYTLCKDIPRPYFEWSSLFEAFPYSKRYKRFVRIFLAASNQDELGDWVGWVKSGFRSLLLKLEEVQGLCDPNPTQYVIPDAALPNTVFYWGLQIGRTSFADATYVEKYFRKHITTGYHGSIGTVELSIVDSTQLPKSALFDGGSGNATKAYWKMIEYNQLRRPIYSCHLPNYIVGYGDPEYTSPWG